jgi:hypothetical protein
MMALQLQSHLLGGKPRVGHHYGVLVAYVIVKNHPTHPSFDWPAPQYII